MAPTGPTYCSGDTSLGTANERPIPNTRVPVYPVLAIKVVVENTVIALGATTHCVTI